MFAAPSLLLHVPRPPSDFSHDRWKRHSQLHGSFICRSSFSFTYRFSIGFLDQYCNISNCQIWPTNRWRWFGPMAALSFVSTQDGRRSEAEARPPPHLRISSLGLVLNARPSLSVTILTDISSTIKTSASTHKVLPNTALSDYCSACWCFCSFIFDGHLILCRTLGTSLSQAPLSMQMAVSRRESTASSANRAQWLHQQRRAMSGFIPVRQAGTTSRLR